MTKVLEDYFDRGVLHPGHPPVIELGTFGTADTGLKAGTVLKLTDGVYAAAAEADTPCAVLLEDVEAHTGNVLSGVLRHGIVVRSRLIDASAAEAAASDTLVNKLASAGIYLSQGGWTDSIFC